MKKIIMLLLAIVIVVGMSSCIFTLTGTICFVNQDVADYDLYIDGYAQGTVWDNEYYFYVYDLAPGDYWCEADEYLGAAYTSGWVNVAAGYTSYFYINEY